MCFTATTSVQPSTSMLTSTQPVSTTTPCQEVNIMTGSNTGITFDIRVNNNPMTSTQKDSIKSDTDASSLTVASNTPIDITNLNNADVTTVKIVGTNINKITLVFNGDVPTAVSFSFHHNFVYQYLYVFFKKIIF